MPQVEKMVAVLLVAGVVSSAWLFMPVHSPRVALASTPNQSAPEMELATGGFPMDSGDGSDVQAESWATPKGIRLEPADGVLAPLSNPVGLARDAGTGLSQDFLKRIILSDLLFQRPRADADGDGTLTDADLDSFIEKMEIGDVAADINADGFLDSQDIDEFLAAFQSGETVPVQGNHPVQLRSTLTINRDSFIFNGLNGGNAGSEGATIELRFEYAPTTPPE